ncbi:MAG: outer membrane lipoprotein chaperone LolA [Thermodesulfovibrionales bacterium]
MKQPLFPYPNIRGTIRSGILRGRVAAPGFRTVLALVLGASVAVAGRGWCAAQPGDLVSELKAQQAKMTSVSARFTQEKRTRLMAKPIRSAGRFFFRQPASVRWEYGGDTQLQVIFNGTDLWLYYPDLKEAEKVSGALPFASLMKFDLSSLSAEYEIAARKEKGVVKVKLVPRVKGFIREIEMDMAGDAAFPGTMRLIDSHNEATVIIFKDVKVNAKLGDELFRFTPPSGVTVRERQVR